MARLYSFCATKRRNLAYARFLDRFDDSTAISLAEVVAFGARLMRRANLHAHFFDDNTLLANAQYLTCFSLNLAYGNTHDGLVLKRAQAVSILALFERRIATRMPVEYLTKQAFYMGRTFYVNADVLVPRSLMSSRFKDFLESTNWQNYRVLDLCCGSGCIGITLALLNPKIKVDLVDISLAALEVAQMNIDLHALSARVQCLHSDLFTNLHTKYDLIITNPPYVSLGDYQRVPLEFKREPQIALASGTTGLDIIQQIIAQAPNYLNPQGRLIAEVGYPAAKLLKKQYKNLPLKWLAYRSPKPAKTWFEHWLKPLLAMDCVLIWDNLFI